jgi:alpha 1,3-glucosidase
MKFDPFTLVIVLGHAGDADGTLYLDDGESFDYNEGAYLHRKFSYSSATAALSSEDLATPGKKTKEYLKSMDAVRVEKIIIVGAPEAWKNLKAVGIAEEGSAAAAGRTAPLEFHDREDGRAAWAIVRDPAVRIGAGWKISFA